MGITISCKKEPSCSIDMGAGGFLRLRRKVSDLVGEPWASHYRELTDIASVHRDNAWYEQFDQITMNMLQTRKVRKKTVSFLLQPDAEGCICWGSCRQLLDVIGDYDDDILYGYVAHPDCARFRDFKKLLHMCVERKCDLIWF